MPSTTNTIQKFDPIKDDSWDKHVRTHADASFFHSANWARVLHATYGHTPIYMGVFSGNEIVASIPLMEVRSVLTGKRGVMLPFTDECPLLLSADSMTEESFHSALQELLAIGRERHWSYLEMRGCNLDGLKLPESDSHWGHVLDLTQSVESIFQGFQSSVRRAIRKAEKSDIEVRFSNSLASIHTYYHLHCQTRKKHGVPPQSLQFFQNIFEHVISKGAGIVATAMHQEKPIAAAVYVHAERGAIYKFGASDSSFLNLRANDLVMWEAIKWYATRGSASFSFGRTERTNEGLRRFKLGFGAREYPIRYFRYDFRRETFISARSDTPEWMHQVLRQVPIPLLRILGAAIYSHSS